MKLSVIMILAFSSLLANAQAGRDKDDFLVSFMGDYTNVDGYISHQGGGINLEVMIGRYVGLQTAFAGNKDYAYFNGIGLLAPLLIVSKGDKKGSSLRDTIQLLQILIFLSILENPSFHIPVGSRFELIPYASLFRARYVWNGAETRGNKGWFASGSIGCKAAFYVTDTFFVNAFYESTRLYAHTTPDGWQAGFSIGFLMRNEK